MSEYDFIYDPLTPEEIIFRKKREELAAFMWTIEYEDMIEIRKYIKNNPEKFSEHIKGYK